jgi:hypothetical protein
MHGQNTGKHLGGQFYPYGNQNEWPPYIGPVIGPDKRLIQRGRRRHNRIQCIWMKRKVDEWDINHMFQHEIRIKPVCNYNLLLG